MSSLYEIFLVFFPALALIMILIIFIGNLMALLHSLPKNPIPYSPIPTQYFALILIALVEGFISFILFSTGTPSSKSILLSLIIAQMLTFICSAKIDIRFSSLSKFELFQHSFQCVAFGTSEILNLFSFVYILFPAYVKLFRILSLLCCIISLMLSSNMTARVFKTSSEKRIFNSAELTLGFLFVKLVDAFHEKSLVVSILTSYVIYFSFVLLMSLMPYFILLEKFHAAMGEFNAKTAYMTLTTHEIRAPLACVSMGIDELICHVNGKSTFDSKGMKEGLRDMKAASDMALVIVNDILALDKLRAGMFIVTPQLASAWDFVISGTRLFHLQAKASRVEIICTSDQLKHRVMIMIDAPRAEPLMRNFISNALKFSTAGSIVRIELSIQPKFSEALYNEETDLKRVLVVGSGGVLRVNVRDSGPGIAKADQRKLFKLFSQVNPEELQQGKGSGIGLWLCKMIIDAHGGVIGVESEGRGKGANFFFELPCSLDDINTMSNKAQQSDGIITKSFGVKLSAESNIVLDRTSVLVTTDDYSESPLMSPSLEHLVSPKMCVKSEKKYRMMLVDDTPLIRKMTRRCLAPLYDVLDEAASGKEALQCLDCHDINHYDIILVDYCMPELRGDEVVKAMRERLYGGLLLGVTGSSNERDRENFLLSGANDVLVKPLSVEAIRSIVNSKINK